MKDFAVIIPVFNESSTIMKVINEVRNCGYEFLVVNDGSTDNTSKILVENHIRHINIIPNQGKGFAILEGADYLIRKGFDWIGIVDGDGQIPIKDIAKLLKLRKKKPKPSIICGNRLKNPQNMPIIRLCANKLMSWIVSLLAGVSIPDSQCGLKCINREVFLNLDLNCQGFDFDSEILIKAGKKGYKIVSEEIECIYFKSRVSKINYLRDWYRFTKLILRNITSIN